MRRAAPPHSSPPLPPPTTTTTTRTGVCLPAAFTVARWAALQGVRPEAQPGTQTYAGDLPQPGCINASGVPVPDRCYAMRSMFADIALPIQRVDDFGRVAPLNYIARALNTTTLCLSLVTQECLQQYGAGSCLLLVQKQLQLQAADVAAAPQASGGGGVQLVVLLPALFLGASLYVRACVRGCACECACARRVCVSCCPKHPSLPEWLAHRGGSHACAHAHTVCHYASHNAAEWAAGL